MDTGSGFPTSQFIVLALLFVLIQAVVLYLVVKAAIVNGLRAVLELLAGQSRQKGTVKAVQDDLRTAARLLRADAADNP